MAYSISLSVTTNSQSVTNNSSNVTVKVNYSWTYGTYSNEKLSKWVKINGTTYHFDDVTINPNQTTSGSGTLYSKTLNIPHNSDGTKTLSVSASVKTTTSSGTQTASKSVTLTTIPRASTISATSAVVGSQSTITISRKSSSFTHTLEYSFGSLSGTIATKTSSTSVKWTLPSSFYAQIGSTATSKSGTITCKTYNGSTLIGTKTASFTAKTSSSTCAPTLSPTVTADSNTQALTGNTSTLIRYYSTANVTFGAAAKNSATLSSKKATNSGKSRTTDGAFTSVTEGSFVFTATDSRGYSTSKTVTNNLINYVKLTCSFSANLLVDGTGTLKISGNYFNGSFGAVDNTLTVQYRYKTSGGTYSSWQSVTATKNNNAYTASVSLSDFDYQNTYVFQARATDKIATVTPSEKSVTALPVFDWGVSDFNHNTDVTLSNGKAIQSFDTSGNKKNLIYLTSGNGLMVGGGSYAPQSINLRAAGDGDIKISNENSDYFSLLGAMKALTTTYILDCTVTNGTDYSGGTASAYLVGNCLRLHFYSVRNTGAGTGNITNETVMTINVKHDGKINNLYRVSATTDTEGGAAHFSIQTSAKDDNNMTITVILVSTTTNIKSLNSYCVMPAKIRLSAYV